MRCFGEFKNDRTCDLCKVITTDNHEKCKGIRQDRESKHQMLRDKKSCCVYRRTCYDEYTPFDACNKNGDGYGRFAPDCVPSETCHIKKEVNK